METPHLHFHGPILRQLLWCLQRHSSQIWSCLFYPRQRPRISSLKTLCFGYQLNVWTNKHIDLVSNMASFSYPISIQASHDLLSASNIEQVVTGDVGSELSTFPPETSKTLERCPTVKIAKERPEWLPEGWTMEARERTFMKWKGVRDRYYYDPMNHQHFRSKKEVERFLKMETVRKYKTKSKEVEPTTDNPQSTLRFDFKNPPAKVSWVLNNFAEGIWTPYINREEVS